MSIIILLDVLTKKKFKIIINNIMLINLLKRNKKRQIPNQDIMEMHR